MNKYCKMVAVLVFMGMLVISSDAGLSYFSFIEEPVSSVITGMGSAGTSIGRGGYNFYNPAGLSISDKSFVSFDFTRLFNDLGRGYFESGWVFPTWFIGGAFQTQADQFQRTDEKGILPDAYGDDRGTLASITTGIKRERYSLGLSFNAVQEVIGEYKAYGFSGNAGAIVTVIPQHIYVGFSAMHAAGRHSTFMDKREWLKSERFPATIRGGVSWEDTLMQQFPLLLSADVVYNYNDKLVTVPVGVDFNVLPPISIRIGKRFNHPTELFSMGVGLRWKNIAFDAAFLPVQFVSDIHIKRSVGLTYMLATPRSSVKSVAVQKTEPIKVSPIVVPIVEISDTLSTGSDKIPVINSTDMPLVDSNVISDTHKPIITIDSLVFDSIENDEVHLEILENGSISSKKVDSDSSEIVNSNSEAVEQDSTKVRIVPEKLPDVDPNDIKQDSVPVDTMANKQL